MWNTQKYLTNYVLFQILNGTSNLDFVEIPTKNSHSGSIIIQWHLSTMLTGEQRLLYFAPSTLGFSQDSKYLPDKFNSFRIFRTHPIFPSLDVLFHPPVPHLWLLLLKKRYDNERSSVNHRSWTWIWTVSRHQLHFGQVIDTPTSRMSIRPLIIGCKLWRLHVVKGPHLEMTFFVV